MTAEETEDNIGKIKTAIADISHYLLETIKDDKQLHKQIEELQTQLNTKYAERRMRYTLYG